MTRKPSTLLIYNIEYYVHHTYDFKRLQKINGRVSANAYGGNILLFIRVVLGA